MSNLLFIGMTGPNTGQCIYLVFIVLLKAGTILPAVENNWLKWS